MNTPRQYCPNCGQELQEQPLSSEEELGGVSGEYLCTTCNEVFPEEEQR